LINLHQDFIEVLKPYTDRRTPVGGLGTISDEALPAASSEPARPLRSLKQFLPIGALVYPLCIRGMNISTNGGIGCKGGASGFANWAPSHWISSWHESDANPRHALHYSSLEQFELWRG
jgi:hypothetical protein